jgi:tetratricopeptide (TPR) repeat protein
MDSFDNLLKTACHLKSYQMSFDKKVFDNLPEFYKTGLYYCDMLKNVRKQSFFLKKISFEVNKAQGAAYLKDAQYEDAIYYFCKGLAIFKYIKSKRENWKNEAIKDEDLEYFDDNENTEVINMKISSLLNIALCNLNTEKFVEARQACDEVIKLDPRNIKAYYRRAKTYLDCKSSGRI